MALCTCIATMGAGCSTLSRLSTDAQASPVTMQSVAATISGENVRAEKVVAAQSSGEGEEIEIHLWPLIESTRLRSGARRTSFLLLYHQTKLPSGETVSFHVLNYMRGPTYEVLFPLYYRAGGTEKRHGGVVPLYFWGPDYKIAPPLLSTWKRNEDGSTSTWVTPLYHMTREPDGSVRDMHVGPYFRGVGYELLFPLYYKVGESGKIHAAVIPFFFKGPDYWIAPPVLSGWWRNKDGSGSTWITPLYHMTRNADGSVRDMHAGLYFQGPGYQVLFPLWYNVGEPGRKHSALIPFYFQGPEYKTILPLLTFWHKEPDGSSSLWVTPLYNHWRDPTGKLRSVRFLNYYRGQQTETFFPLYYRSWEPGNEQLSIVPFYFGGHDYRVVPPLLSGWWKHEDGSASTWITPVYHHTKNTDGSVRDMHFGPYVQGPGYQLLFPLWYRVGEPGKKHSALLPLYFQGPDYKVVPPLLSGQWKRNDGSTATWITPLYHQTRNADNSLRNMHAGPYLQGAGYQVLFPLWYRVGDEGWKHSGLIPFYFQGPNYKTAPLALSGWWREKNGAESTWITPLYHHTRNPDGTMRNMHSLLYFGGPGYQVLFPLFYKVGQPGNVHAGIIPFYFEGPNFKVLPPVLSGWWKHSNGAASTWITPLFHKTRDPQGNLRNFHVLNYFQGPGYKLLPPLYYETGAPGKEHMGLVPFYFRGPGYKVVFPLWYKTGERSGLFPIYFSSPNFKTFPLLLYFWMKHANNATSTWVTPLYHKTVGADGQLRNLHAGPYLRGQGYELLFPLYYKVGPAGKERIGVIPFYFRGPDYKTVPLALSGWWKRKDNSTSTWVTPLYHNTRNSDGAMRNMHCLLYFAGTGYQVLFPFYYKVGQPDNFNAGIIPFYFQGPNFKVVPPALSGWWKHKDGSTSTWLTPLYHHTKAPDGTLRDIHIGPYLKGPNYELLLPLYYKVGPPGYVLSGVIPFYARGPNYWMFPLLLSEWTRNADKSETLWLTPFFHITRSQDKSLRTFHLLNYFQDPVHQVLFPLWYRVGEKGRKHSGLIPFYFQGPNYKTAPLMLSGWRKQKDGSATTWLTPLYHHTRNADGTLRDMHIALYSQGPGHQVLFPLWYRVGEPGKKNSGLIPLYFQGPGYKVIPPVLSGWWKNKDGSASTWLTPLYHHTKNPDGSVRDMHFGPYLQGPGYTILFPLWYRAGDPGRKHSALLPLYFQGPDYRVLPPLLSGRWKNNDGSATTWITPAYHLTKNSDGSLRDMHFGPYLQGPGYQLLFPLWYRVGEPGRKHSALFPLYFQGPGYKVVPPLLSVSWKQQDGTQQTWFTLAAHLTREADGTMRNMHVLNFYHSRDETIFFPLFGRGRLGNDDILTTVPFLFRRIDHVDGEVTASVLAPLFAYRNAKQLDTSLSMGLRPFSYQRAGNDSEFAFMWRMYHVRRQANSTSVTVGPLWWSNRPEPWKPMRFQVLGGLFARDCNYERGSYRYRILWVIPIGARRHFSAESGGGKIIESGLLHRLAINR